MPISRKTNLSSCDSNDKLFIPISQLNFIDDGCSSMVECTVVVRETRVRFPPSVYKLEGLTRVI